MQQRLPALAREIGIATEDQIGVIARGGQVVSIPFEHERSTSALVSRIRKA